MKSLVGMFVITNSEDRGSYRTGELVEELLLSSHYLIQFDDMTDGGVLMPMMLVSLDELSNNFSCNECGGQSWEFFNTRKEMQDYIDHINPPTTMPGKVMKLPVKPKTKS